MKVTRQNKFMFAIFVFVEKTIECDLTGEKNEKKTDDEQQFWLRYFHICKYDVGKKHLELSTASFTKSVHISF
jgi:predicted solute-binding protein